MLIKRPIGSALALLAAVLTTGVAAHAGPGWSLDLHDRTYVYTLTVSSPLPKDRVLDVLFDPRHVAVFSKSAGRLVLISEGVNVNEVRFDTRKLIFKCSTTFRRTIDREAGSIEIEMLSFKAGWGKLAPHARSSRARYLVADKGAFREVVYRQEVETDKPVSGYSLRSLRGSMEEFARDLERYLQRRDLAGDASLPAGAPRGGGT